MLDRRSKTNLIYIKKYFASPWLWYVTSYNLTNYGVIYKVKGTGSIICNCKKNMFLWVTEVWKTILKKNDHNF